MIKQPINIPFSKGVNQKVDPWQLPLGQFQALNNSVFTKDGLMQKRNGYGSLTSLPNNSSSYVTTLNDNLTAVGPSISAYNETNQTWVSKGSIQPVELSTLPVVRNSINQIQCDSVVSPNLLLCTVYTEKNLSSTAYKVVVSDSITGQNILAPTLLPVTSGAVSGSPKVFVLGPYFIVVYTVTISGVKHLQYCTLPYAQPAISVAVDLVSAYDATTTVSWDGLIVNNALYVAYNTVAASQNVKYFYVDQNLNKSAEKVFAGKKANVVSLCSDITNPSIPIIYISFYDAASTSAYSAAIDRFLNVITAPTLLVGSGAFANIASAAQNGSVTIYLEATNAYSYDSSIPSNYIVAYDMTQAGSVSSVRTVIRSVGLASKAFIVNGVEYILCAYQSTYQPTYFLINASHSTSASPVITSKLAYSNGGGYLTLGLPSVSISGTVASIPYLYKDLIASVNKGTNLPTGTQTAGVYSQTGINLVNFDISTLSDIDTSEIAGDLHISGGFLWLYDGYLPVEHSFFVWPDMDTTTPADAAVWSASGGSMDAKPDTLTNTNAYWYQVTYEWSDNQGNIYKSAPSIPIPVTTSGSGSSGSVVLNIPTLRLTYKTANPVKICVYRWSLGQQEYYQTSPSVSQANPALAVLLNDTTTDSVTFTDTYADATILGNSLLYTAGGVVEDINAPASSIMTIFDTRLWLVDAEDPNLLWYSKQVIESTPVEMSDLLTYYVAPNTGTTGSTGPVTALAPMDDKLIIFKKNAIYYINGTGPDNTGANSQYPSSPIFITSTVGCANQDSLVLMPNGIMFQSDKGIWILGRDLATSYIGAAVENFNSSLVTSANAIPQTNQVRFTLSTGEFLVYDYFYERWGTFTGIPAISSCIYQGAHTLINSSGEVYQETPGLYLDGSNPVLMSFTTSWLNLAGVQGYQRAFFFFILGRYLSPHKLNISVAYDYNSSPYQSSLITPNNFSGNVPSSFGAPVPFGGPGDVENWRVFLGKQRCQSFQISLNEVYDPSSGFAPGAGLTISGINLVVGIKKGWRNIGANSSVGGSVANG